MGQEQLEELLRKAIAAGQGRDYNRAIVLLKEVLVRSDEYPQALLYLGRSYHALKDYYRAIQACRGYLDLRPSSGVGHFFMGRSCLSGGLYRQAAYHLQEAVRSNPESIAALSLLGLALLRVRRPDAAVLCFRQALDLQPDNPRILTGYLNALLTHGIRLFRAGDLPASAEAFRTVLSHQSGSLAAHMYLASICRELGEPAEALTHYDEAVRLSPQDPALRLQKALVHLGEGQQEEALAELEQATRMLGSDGLRVADAGEMQRLIALVLFKADRYREAVFYACQVLRREQGDADMHLIAAESYRHLEELKKARNHYRRALEGQRGALEPRYGLVEVLWKLGEYAELADELKRVFTLSLDDEVGQYYLALTLPHLGRAPQKTIKVLQDAIRRQGPDPRLMAALGREYLRADLPKLAEGWFQRTLRLVEDDANCLRDLAEVYHRLGKRRENRQALRRYLEYRPGDRMARRELIALLQKDAAEGRETHEELVRQILQYLPQDPHNIPLKRQLALSCRRTGRFAEAVILYRELLRENPSSLGCLRALAYCLEASDRREAAVELLEKAMKSLGEQNPILMPLGILHFRAGRLEQAARLFRKAIGNAPRAWQPYRNLGIVYLKSGNEEFGRKFLRQAETLRQQPSAKGG